MTRDVEQVYFYEAFEEEAAALRAHLDEGVRAGFTWKTVQEAGDDTPPAPLISVRTQSVIPLAWAGALGGILSRSTGYDHLERYVRESGVNVPCGYLPLYCARAVGEQAVMLAMCLLRRLPRQMGNFRNFTRDGLTGRECAGATMLVVGVGHIGREVVALGRGLGMRVLGVDLDPKHDDVEYVRFADALPEADVIVCAMNLTSENVAYFNADSLAGAKRGAVFVNISRGEISPSADLCGLLDAGVLGGVALDVFDAEAALAVALREDRETDDPRVEATLSLAQRPNVILTPHNAFNTIEAVERKSADSVTQVRQFLAHGSFKWAAPIAAAVEAGRRG